MIKHLLKISFYTFITFCVVNFLSLIISMITNKTNGTFPNFEIGFPLTFYYQFLMDENDLHHGFKKGLIGNVLFSFIIVFLYFQLKTRNFKLTTNNKQHK